MDWFLDYKVELRVYKSKPPLFVFNPYILMFEEGSTTESIFASQSTASLHDELHEQKGLRNHQVKVGRTRTVRGYVCDGVPP
jgi:hypothetical protein